MNAVTGLSSDLTWALAGPHAAMMLGDIGARVIKVESPGGDDTRGWGPPFVGGAEGTVHSTYFLSCNQSKESVTLDLETESGARNLRRFVTQFDVLMENFRTGVLDRLGFSTEELQRINPRLAILSITGFGHDGPEGGRAGYDQIAQGEAGLVSITGPSLDEPTKVGVPIGDLFAGMYGAFGVVSTLVERSATGHGTIFRTSLLAAIVGVHGFQGTCVTVAGEVPVSLGNHHQSIAPYGLFRAADASVQVAVGSELLRAKFAPIVGLDPIEDYFATNSQRVQQRDKLIKIVEDTFELESAEHWLTKLVEAEVSAGKVRPLDDVYLREQTKSQGLLIDVEHPVLEKLSLPGPPLSFNDNKFAGARGEHRTPPTLGQHNASVVAWLDDCDERTAE